MQACAKCLACINSLDPSTVVTPMLEIDNRPQAGLGTCSRLKSWSEDSDASTLPPEIRSLHAKLYCLS